MVQSLPIDGNRSFNNNQKYKNEQGPEGHKYSGSLSEKPESLHLYCLCKNSKPFWSEDTILVSHG